MALTDVASAAELESAVKGATPCVVHFWAPWCEPCTHMDTVLRQLAAENTHAKFLRVEAEEQPDISEQYSVSSVPLFVFFKSGAPVDRLEGANAPELAHKVAQHMATSTTSHTGSSSGVGATASPAQVINTLQQTLATAVPPGTNGYALGSGREEPAPENAGLTAEMTKRLQALVTSQPAILFMKGTPEEPRCGFSSKVVAALNEVGVPFGTFDILSDADVRQGLKTFSDWPTFPQLYAGGELVGGCDIVLEMHRSGDLRKTLEEATGKQAKSAAADTSTSTGGGELKEKLPTLISSSPTMLFMKGSPDAPQCGFSRKVVEALREAGVEFGSFDILTDEAVRQSLKEFSQWPTYPQLYHKGEFVGGCDIVLELKRNDELKSTLTV